MPNFFTKKQCFGDEELEVIYRETKRPIDPSADVSAEGAGMGAMGMGVAPKFNPRTYLAAPDILCEQDVAVKMRDGITIYVDIFRPANETPVPALVSWSFYGKRPGEGMTEWQVMGVPPGTISTMAKFESPDPAYWCRKGYAVVNVDPRGTGNSEGDICMFGSQDGRDGYDCIEWLAQQHWCTGKIALAGNSAVAMSQWRIAAEVPPHLTCIAPWEGTGDIYRESIYEGGIPALTFNEFIVSQASGLGGIDDQVENAKKYPLMNAYWEDKIPNYRNIRIPCYVTACWNHFHLSGSFNGFKKIRSPKKWIRAHRDFEWPDAYCTKGIQELQMFFDRYLKDIHNGWELTPRVRLEVQDVFDINYDDDRKEKEFPLKRTQYKKLFIDAASQKMSFDEVAEESSVSYDSNDGLVNFDIQFEEDTEITGYMKLRIWVAAKDHDEMDLFINVKKLSTTGEELPITLFGEPHPGAWGKMRVSHRKLDEAKSKHYLPVQAHLEEEKLKPGEIVPVDIAIVPTSRFWHKGQSLRVEIAGRYIRREGWFEPLTWETDNKGEHVIYAGGKYDSYLQVPIIPPKFQDGDILYR